MTAAPDEMSRRTGLVAWEESWNHVAESVQQYLPIAQSLRERYDTTNALAPSIAGPAVAGDSIDDVCSKIDQKLLELNYIEEQLRLSASFFFLNKKTCFTISLTRCI